MEKEKKEKLQIKNFAGLKNVTIDVLPITGFIGPQASGKSVIAKLLYFFREIITRLPVAITEGKNETEFKTECGNTFGRYFPRENLLKSRFEITYESGSEQIYATNSNGRKSQPEGLVIDWSQFFSAAIKELERGRRPIVNERQRVDQSAVHGRLAAWDDYYEKAKEPLGPWSRFEQIFIPAGRAYWSQFSDSMPTLLDANVPLDPFMLKLEALLNNSKSLLRGTGLLGGSEQGVPLDDESLRFLRSRFNAILKSEIEWSENEFFLRHQDGRLVNLVHASSGQQEAVPLLLLLARFWLMGKRIGRAVYIEEPEGHVFPSTQKQIIDFVARAFRARMPKMSLVVTTHSPYILTSFNNLLEAGRLYADASPAVKKRLEGIVSRRQALLPGEVAFYALKDGGAESIIDPETKLINAAAIDGVSEEIATQFDDLLAEGNEKR